MARQSFHYSVVQRSNFQPNKIPEVLEATNRRLQGVQLEKLSFDKAIEKYDRPTTFFYIDPPYWGLKLYQFNFDEKDFRQLRAVLQKIKGKFLLSLNDLPEVRKLFAGFHIRPITLAYSAQMKAGRRYSELLISNYKLD